MNFDPNHRRVVITGMGVISASGQTLDRFWNNVVQGLSAACRVTRFDVSKLPNRIAAEIKDFDCTQFMDARAARRLELSIQYGVAAARLAVEDARLKMDTIDADRIGVVEATAVGGMESTLKAYTAFLAKGYRGMSPFTFINAYNGGGCSEIALELGIRGHAITYCSGCCSSNDAMGYAMGMIRSDDCDVMVAGGTEAPLIEGFWNGFCVTRVMTRRNETPKEAMRPFDRTRDGLLLGEGSAFLILEELTHALNRGAKIYAELVGHGRNCEAYHSVAPHPEGKGLRRAMEKALRDARLPASEVDYINAHGSATETNDVAETLAIKKLFGAEAKRLAISSTKPVTGHLLGGAGALETVICALTIKHQVIPPTLNLTNPDETCDLDFVLHRPRPYPVKVAMNNSSGFGGKNSSLIIRQYSES